MIYFQLILVVEKSHVFDDTFLEFVWKKSFILFLHIFVFLKKMYLTNLFFFFSNRCRASFFLSKLQEPSSPIALWLRANPSRCPSPLLMNSQGTLFILWLPNIYPTVFFCGRYTGYIYNTATTKFRYFPDHFSCS